MKVYEAKGKVFVNEDFSLGTFNSKKKAKRAINNFRYNYDMPGNNWHIISFWIEKKKIIPYKSKELGEYDYEC